jgi:hypothetical protein
MMATTVSIAKEVVQALAEHNAKFSCVPEFKLGELSGMKVVVVPVGVEFKTLARNTIEITHRIQIGILKRCTEDDLEGMISFAQTVAHSLLYRKFGDAIGLSVAFNPLYVPEHFRERRQFTSVLELTCKETS